MSGPNRVFQLVLGAMACAGVTFGFTELVPGALFTLALAIASAVPPLVAAGCRRLPGWGSAVAQVVIGAIGVAFVAGAGPAALAEGLTSGWSRLLSTTLPADADAAVVVPLAALIWAISAATSEAVLRAEATFLPALPLAGGALGARLLEGDNVGLPGLVGVCAGVVALVLLCAVRADAGIEPSGRRRLPLALSSTALLGAALATSVALLAGPAVPARAAIRDRPYDPRTLRNVAPAESDVDNPLAMVRAAGRRGAQELAQVTTTSSGGEVAVYLRLVALDRYDGSIWSSTSQYRVAGEHLPQPATATGPTVALRQDVVVKELDTPWLAVADRPVRLQGMAVLHDAAQGTLAATADQPLRPDGRYRAESLVARADPARLANASAADASDVHHALPSGLPPLFAAEADAAVADAAGSDFARLAALQAYFADGYAVEASQVGGQSLVQLARFIERDRRVAPSSAEFAAAFAVMARTLGYASRVVVGFTPFPSGGTRTLRRGDLHAWPEVALRDFGWVPFEPTPRRGASPGDPGTVVPVASPAALASAVAADPTGSSSSGTPVTQPPPVPATGAGPKRTWALTAAAGLVVVLLALATPVGLKARRRRQRRRSRDPAACVLGAWAEALDRLAERGVERDRTATSRDVLRRTEARLGSEVLRPMSTLGSLATMAVCAPPGSLEPSSGGQAWSAAEQLARSLRHTGTLPTRARAAIDPRPLLRRRGR